MRSVIVAGILLAVAVWLTLEGPRETSVAKGEVAEVVPSDRRRAITFVSHGLDKRGGALGGLERHRAAVRQFGEDELLEMLKGEGHATGGESVKRRYAIWERLGELKSEDGLELLLALEGATSPNGIWSHPRIESHGSHAFIGGWAASLSSLEEVRQELFPQLLRLKKAGIHNHEFALGREMARFDPIEVWEMLTAPQTAETPFSGQEFTLNGLVMAMAGKPELSILLPLIQVREVSSSQARVVTSFSGSNVQSWDGELLIESQSILTSPVGGAVDVSDSILSYDTFGSSLSVGSDDIVILNSPSLFPEPHLFSQAVGALMLSDPAAALGYFQEKDHPFEVQVARPNEVWETMAKLDSNAAMRLLHEPEFEEFKLGIAKGLINSFPERVEGVMAEFSTLAEQELLLGAAIQARWALDDRWFAPAEPLPFEEFDSEEVVNVIERAIDYSEIDDVTKSDLREQLNTTSRVIKPYNLPPFDPGLLDGGM